MSTKTWIKTWAFSPQILHTIFNYQTTSFSEIKSTQKWISPQIETQFQEKKCKILADETKMHEYKFILAYIVRIYLIILTAC